jgi:uncharacterized protein
MTPPMSLTYLALLTAVEEGALPVIELTQLLDPPCKDGIRGIEDLPCGNSRYQESAAMTERQSVGDDARLRPARQTFPSPIPTHVVSNGEFTPSPQTRRQRGVENRIKDKAATFARRHGVSRRAFLASAAGMAAALAAMNEVYGPLFAVDAAEAAEPGSAAARAQALSSQFIVDLHTHFIRDDAGPSLQYFADLRERTRRMHQNPELPDRPATLNDLHLGTYVREMWFDSDTKIAALSGAPSDIKPDWLLPNHAIAAARDAVNRFAGSRRLLSHFIFTPGQPGWLDAIDRGIEDLKPDAWKGYTIGDNTHKELSHFPWHMDDEQVAYKGYEKFAKSGIRNVAVHKGLYTETDTLMFAISSSRQKNPLPVVHKHVQHGRCRARPETRSRNDG